MTRRIKTVRMVLSQKLNYDQELLFSSLLQLSLCSSCYIFANCFCPAGRKTFFLDPTRPERQIHFATWTNTYLQFVQIHIKNLDIFAFAIQKIYLCNLDKYILGFQQIHIYNLDLYIFLVSTQPKNMSQFGQIYICNWEKYLFANWGNTYLPIAFARKTFFSSQLGRKDKGKLVLVGTLGPVTWQIAKVLTTSNQLIIQYIHHFKQFHHIETFAICFYSY